MKKILFLTLAIVMSVSLTACSGSNQSSSSGNDQQSTAQSSSSSVSQASSNSGSSESRGITGGPSRSPRVIKNGTAVTLTIGKTVIPATLNHSTSSKELISRLPYTVHLNRYSHDYCGVMDDPLKYDKKDVHYGWLNGDIDFATDANYFTILFEEQDTSKQYGYQVNMGKVDGDLSVIKNLQGPINVRIALANK